MDAPRNYQVVGCSIRASWLDANGEMRMGHARILTIHEGGMELEFPDPPRSNSLVRLTSEKIKLTGTAHVRKSERMRGKHLVSIEFADGLRWHPPSEVQEPVALGAQGTFSRVWQAEYRK